MTAGYRSVVGFWYGGLSATPSTNAGYRSTVGFWYGGLSATPTTQPAGYRSVTGFWYGGLSAVPVEGTPPPPPWSSGGGWGGGRRRKRKTTAQTSTVCQPHQKPVCKPPKINIKKHIEVAFKEQESALTPEIVNATVFYDDTEDVLLIMSIL